MTAGEGAAAAAGITCQIDGVSGSDDPEQPLRATWQMENWTRPVRNGRESTRFRQFRWSSMDEIRIWNVARSQAQIAGARST